MPAKRHGRSDERNFMFVACDGPKGAVNKRAKAQANRHVMLNLQSTSRQPRSEQPAPPRVVIRFKATELDAGIDQVESSSDHSSNISEPPSLTSEDSLASGDESSGGGSSTSSGRYLQLHSPRLFGDAELQTDLDDKPRIKEESENSTRSVAPSWWLGATSPLAASQNRISMQAGFCRFFFPRGYSVNTAIVQTVIGDRRQAPGDLALQQATDAMCTLIVGLKFSNKDWIRGSLSIYSSALQAVQYAIRHINWSKQADNLIAAIYFLLKYETLLCQDYLDLGWHHHAKALLGFLDPSMLKRMGNSPAVSWALQNAPFYIHGHALVQKRAIVYHPLLADHLVKDPRAALSRAPMRAPAVLARFESLSGSTTARLEAPQALAEALRLRRDLRNAMSTWVMSLDGMPYYETSIENFPECRALLTDELASLFPDTYMFPNIAVALACRVYWTTLLVLNDSILTFAKTYLSACPCDEGLAPELAQSVDNLCRSLPYLSSSVHFGLSGGIAHLEPLHFVMAYLRSVDDQLKLSWCEVFKQETTTGWRVGKILSQPD